MEDWRAWASANSVLSSSSSHSSSSSSASSAGFRRPPTLERRSRSAALASRSCCSFSSAYSSALSPANSFSWMRKSRRFSLNRSYWEFRVNSPSTNALIWGLRIVSSGRITLGKPYAKRLGKAFCSRLATNSPKNSLLPVPSGACPGA